jgi:hypothetical protein
MKTDEINVTNSRHPNARMQRLSQTAGFVPWRPGDPMPEVLLRELNVAPIARQVRLLAMRQTESEPTP